MNILYLTNHLNIGGITSYVLTLAGGMKKRGHQVYIASSGGALLPNFIEAGIIYFPVPMRTKQEVSPGILFSFFKLSGLIKKNNITLVHSNSRTTQVLGVLLARSCRIRHFSTCHGFFKKRFFRRLFPCWGEKVIAISDQVKEHLIQDFKVAGGDIAVIHNGIDMNKFKPQALSFKLQAKSKLGLIDAPVVGIVARLSDVKGHAYLINAMRQVIQKLPQAKLLIVGEGKLKEELVRRVETAGIKNNVKFLPAVADTQEVLSAMDVFVMPSLKEGLGLALMEAEASGLAVIGSDVGGIKTLIKDGYNGILIKPADTESLSKAILGLLEDAKKREFLANNAQGFIKQNFSQEKMVSMTETLYSYDESQ